MNKEKEEKYRKLLVDMQHLLVETDKLQDSRNTLSWFLSVVTFILGLAIGNLL